MTTIALIDGDIFAYEAASAAEQPTDWGEGLRTLHAFEEPAKAHAVSRINALAEAVNADRIVLTLSDSGNWRKDVLPTYKSNRDGTRRPMLLKLVKDHLAEVYETFIRPRLEADDVLGILSTGKMLKGEKIIITKDKDLRTIPGKLYFSHKPTLGIIEVSEEEADYWHLHQTLTGDPTDGYSGCPGVGPDTAKAILDDPYGWEAYEHTFKSGPRKDTTETRWKKAPVASVWDAIVSHFIKAGLSEDEALTQARVARICRASDFNFKTKEVRLWKP